MAIVVWPIGDPGYEFASPSSTLGDVAVHVCPNQTYLEELSSRNGYRLLEEDWVQGRFSAKFAQNQTAVCAFAQRNLVHVIWAAIGSEAGKRLLNDPPLNLDWSRSSILSGAYTPPAFRGKRVFPATLIEGLKHLRAQGLTHVYASVHRKNSASLKGMAKASGFQAATCFRVRLYLPGRGIKYIPLLTYGYKPSSNGRWYRCEFTDRQSVKCVPIEV
jgi:hypothetical protein